MRVAVFSRRCGGRSGTLHVPTVVRVSPPPCPCEPEIPFGRLVPLFIVSAVTSASAVALRHRSQAKRNGARRRTEEGEKTGGGENSAVSWDVPAAARLFPFLSRCVAPFRKTHQRRAEPPAREGTWIRCATLLREIQWLLSFFLSSQSKLLLFLPKKNMKSGYGTAKTVPIPSKVLSPAVAMLFLAFAMFCLNER